MNALKKHTKLRCDVTSSGSFSPLTCTQDVFRLSILMQCQHRASALHLLRCRGGYLSFESTHTTHVAHSHCRFTQNMEVWVGLMYKDI